MYKIKTIDGKFYIVRDDGIIVYGYFKDWMSASNKLRSVNSVCEPAER